MKILVLLLLLPFFTASQSITPCVDQLHNLYLSKGLTLNVSNKPVIDYVTGYYNPGNISYVSVIAHFEDTAAYYQARINASIDVTISYLSFDIPLCATDIIMSCAGDSVAGMTNKTCSNVVDYDLGFPSILAGRLYIYLNHTLPCNGTVNITFMNTYLQGIPMTTRYIYDVSGLFGDTPIALPLDPATAREQYRTSGCNYSDGLSIPFAKAQRQFVCVDQTIACVVTNTITARAPADFSVSLQPCTATQPSVCIPLNGSASSQTGNATLFYKWTAVMGWNLSSPVYDSVICNDYVSGILNANQATACVIFAFPGLYRFNLTVFDNTTAISIDTVYINVVPVDAPLVLPNETIGFYPPPPLRTDPPINRPIVTFPTTPPQIATNPPIENSTFINTTVASLLNRYPPLGMSQMIAVRAMQCVAALFFVIFIGVYIALMPNNETNYLDRIRYFNQ